VLFAIELLLLNDHYLKGAFPSWWTGKLSDVAGLFFFPFIVTAVLGIALALVGFPRLRAEKVGRLAFMLVGVWFGLMKVNPAVNGLTISFWEWLVGGPVFIVMDGSDLLALPVLFPAWRLWRSQLLRVGGPGQGRRSLVWDWRVWLVSGTAVFAAMATSCDTQHHISRVFEVGGDIYGLSRLYYLDGTKWGDFFAKFSPDTNRWEELNEVPEAAVEVVEQSIDLPQTKCVNEDSSICYRIEGNEKVFQSNDGGETWKIAWEVPAGRRTYMERHFLPTCKGPIDMGPFDMLISGKDNTHRVVVAFGNEGVVVRGPDGVWERQPVMSAAPTPFIGSSFDDVLDKAPLELVAWLAFVFVYFWIIYLLFIGSFRSILTFNTIVGAIILFILLIVSGFDVYLVLIGSLGLLLEGTIPFILLLVGLICFAIYTALRNRIGSKWRIQKAKKVHQARTVWIISTITLLFVGVGLLSSWTFGFVSHYWLMVALLVVAAVSITIWSVRRNFQLLAELREVVGVLDGS
jgi:hypothetical protein